MQQSMGSRLATPPAVVTDGGNDGVLPTDVLYNILLRVPADELCRLRPVCRAWRALISDPGFVRAHSSRNPLFAALVSTIYDAGEKKHLHVVNLSGDVVKRVRVADLRRAGDKLTGMLPPAGVRISGSSCGNACVLNPATGAVTVLLTHYAMLSGFRTTFLVGRIPATGEHKVLHMYQGDGDDEQKCEVMTLDSCRDQRWRSGPSPPARVLWISESRLVIAGVAYFLLCPCPANTRPKDIASFDLATEEWRPGTLRGPLRGLSSTAEEKIDYWRDLNLAELNGSLVMAHINSQISTTDLWFLDDLSKELWAKRYSIRCSPEWGWDEYDLYPLVVLDDGRIILWDQNDRVLRAYDPRTSTWAELAALKNYSGVGMLEGSLLC